MGSTPDNNGISTTAAELLAVEQQFSLYGFSPNGYHTMPVFIARANGVRVWDVDDKEYLDFTCMLGAINQGHCHPVIANAVIKQMLQVPLVNMSAHSAVWPPFAKMMCERFQYDRIASMMSGTDAAEAACRTARKWGIGRKKIPAEELLILGLSGCYHGHSASMASLQDDSPFKRAAGLMDTQLMCQDPETKEPLRYGDIEVITRCIKLHHHRISAVLIECIRGELDSIEQEIEYCEKLFDLCQEHNILFIADEIRVGCGKTGRFLGCDYLRSRKPDIITLGKSITGGFYPASFVLGKAECMDLLGRHDAINTYSFSPLAVAATVAALQVIDNEQLVEKAKIIGMIVAEELATWKKDGIEKAIVRGGEILIPLPDLTDAQCTEICRLCMERGLLLLPRPYQRRIRLNIPLICSDDDLMKGLGILKAVLKLVRLKSIQ